MATKSKEKILSNLKDMIEANLKDYLPDEYKDAKISFTEVVKNNDEKKAALIIQKEGSKVTPTIYLESFIDMYEDPVASENEILSTISDIYVKHVKSGDGLGGKFIDRISGGFEGVKDIIVMQVVNTRMNEESLKEIPHREVEDLSLTYRLYLDRGADESIATVRISDQMMEQWGVTEQDLYDAAVKNTKELLPTKVESMQSILSGLMGGDMDALDGGLDMYVITNEKKVNGAASVFCDTEALDGLCDKLGGSMYLIPSSIHEFIALPEGKDGGLSGKAAEFASMIKEVNATTLIPEEILGTEPYHYDKENGFEFAERYEQRLRELSNSKEAEVANMSFVINKADMDGRNEATNDDPEVAVPSGLHM